MAILATKIKKEMRAQADLSRAAVSKSFFKTGKGQYGEGDVFIGVSVPDTRIVAKKYLLQISFEDIADLLASREHEYRLLALHMLVLLYKNADTKTRKKIALLYLAHTAHINNWDLVDLSALYIVGNYLYKNSTPPQSSPWRRGGGKLLIICKIFGKNYLKLFFV
jgi:3-methyladenine DNA glycosylase AlkD